MHIHGAVAVLCASEGLLIITAGFIVLVVPYEDVANGSVEFGDFAAVDGQLQGHHAVATQLGGQCSFVVAAFGESLIVPLEGVAGDNWVINGVSRVDDGFHSNSFTFTMGDIIALADVICGGTHRQR